MKARTNPREEELTDLLHRLRSNDAILNDYDLGFIRAIEWILGKKKCPYTWDKTKADNPSKRY